MKQKVLKIELIGAENTEILTKSPANIEDVVAACHFLTESSELRVSIIEVDISKPNNA